eukprot:CAMPEP_0194540984 /NCGR_PEP_ID=MMETSP0253-20130528/81493_1 /TAXON_ID=2966 /ORGANISM="Noctiluca scintillans" /LENGTH=227 /DNA_ID=CAMNT_0039387423 /DNA_START=140 /DNA_END=823 /DNA_ORIENTATION=+
MMCLALLSFAVWCFGKPFVDPKRLVPRWLWTWLSLSILLSALMELHVAAGFVALYCRLRCLMRCLGRSVYVPWVVAVLAGALLLATDSAKPYSWFCISISGITCSFYVCAAWRSRWYPGQALFRSCCMAWLYPLNFALTIGPDVIGDFLGWSPALCVVTPLSLSLNGFFNYLVYVRNSQFSGGVLLAVDVGIRERREFEKWSGIGCVPVGFVIDPVFSSDMIVEEVV